MSETWKPHATVAAVIEREGCFLVVEEASDGRVVYNQPAGHVEEDETLLEAMSREVLEETGRAFTPQAVTGLYRWKSPLNGITYLRLAVMGTVGDRTPGLELDADIITTHWKSREELAAESAKLRSPLVLRCIDDYLAGQRYPLELLGEIPA